MFLQFFPFGGGGVGKGWVDVDIIMWYGRKGKGLIGGLMKISEQERFFRHVDWHGPEVEGRPEMGRCWLWKGASAKGNHGLFMQKGGKLISAHRYPYKLRYGF